MIIKDFFLQNFVMLFELVGLLILLGVSAHISLKKRRNTRLVIVLLLLEAIVYWIEVWTQTFDTLSLARPLLTATKYSLYPLILFLLMQIISVDSVSKRADLLLLIPEFISVPFFYTSQWTRLICWYSDENGYHGGPLNYWPYILFAFYVVVFLIRNFIYFKRYSPINRLALLFIVLGSSGGVILYLVFEVTDDFGAVFTSAILLYYVCVYIQMARIDPMTTLYNRQSFYQDIINRAGRITGVMSIDMNELKYINDTFGHEAGDKALMEVSRIFWENCGPNGVVYRVGGDEFIVIYIGTTDKEPYAAMEAMQKKLAETPYICAFGYASKAPDVDVESAMREADRLMYENKAVIKREMQERGETVHYRQ